MNALFTTVLSVVSAILATLLTIFLTPRLQHYFWKQERREELRLAAIKEFNTLIADYLTNQIANPGVRPHDTFFQSFQVTTAEVKALFSENAWNAFKDVENMIGPGFGPGEGRTVNDLVEARDRALRVLYAEIGILRTGQ